MARLRCNPCRPGLRRWLLGAGATAVLLGVYAFALHRASLWRTAAPDPSLRAPPALEAHTPRDD